MRNCLLLVCSIFLLHRKHTFCQTEIIRKNNGNEEKKKIKGDWKCSGGKWQLKEEGLDEGKQKVKNPLKIMM